MTLIIFVAITAFTIGIIVACLWVKGKVAARIADLQSKLEAERSLRLDNERKLEILHSDNIANAKSLSIAEQEKAVLISQLQHAGAIQLELRAATISLRDDIKTINDSLTQALQEKVRKESQVSNLEKSMLLVQEKGKQAEIEQDNLRRLNELLKEDNTILKAKNEGTLARLNEQHAFLQEANVKLKDAFNALSAEALKNNNESFVSLAKSTLETQVAEAKGEFDKKQVAIDALVKPLSESLGKFDTKIQDLEKVRLEQHGQINQYIQSVQQTTEKLQRETHNLVSALKTSHGRGRYGEIALRRVVEVAGMTEHCDFEEQVSVLTEDGLLRPDMIIRLPERKTIVVDSKIPLAAYSSAFETEDEDERKMLLIEHADAVRDHLKKLSQKAYWSQFTDSPDWVVFYMQIESSFGAALQVDPTLVEDAIKNRVIFATPTTLITLLRTVGFVWQQVSIAENIEQIRDAGIELYNRTTILLKHFASIGGSLKNAVSHYNSAVSSLESRFVPQARKLFTLGSAYTRNDIPELDPVELSVREIGVAGEPISIKAENSIENNGEEILQEKVEQTDLSDQGAVKSDIPAQ